MVSGTMSRIFYLHLVLRTFAILSTISASTIPLTYGPRPFWLLDEMSPGKLKEELLQCRFQTPRPSRFSIGHRGAQLQFPEHTRESYIAAARMGAGILECDVTFTKDLQLVCRHSQCDLHTTTNILETKLASKCSVPFKPARNRKPVSVKCCTSDITLQEFLSLRGKMDGGYRNASSIAEYISRGTPRYRTDLYATSGTLMSHAESIKLFKSLGVKFTPELKDASGVQFPFRGFTQEKYAQKLVDEYKQANVPAEHVWLQSFNLADVKYWIEKEQKFGKQAVYLDGRYEQREFNPDRPAELRPSFRELYRVGVRIIAPPIWVLLKERNGRIVPSNYGIEAKKAGLDLITWTLEAAGAPPRGFFLQSYKKAIKRDGDMYYALDVLARKLKVLGIFTDWPATVTYYANCFRLP